MKERFAIYSQYVQPGQRLTKQTIQEIHTRETISACRRGEYIGLWHLCALAHILNMAIVSVYPEYGARAQSPS